MFCVSTSVLDHRASIESECKFGELLLFFYCEFWDSNSGSQTSRTDTFTHEAILAILKLRIFSKNNNAWKK